MFACFDGNCGPRSAGTPKENLFLRFQRFNVAELIRISGNYKFVFYCSKMFVYRTLFFGHFSAFNGNNQCKYGDLKFAEWGIIMYILYGSCKRHFSAGSSLRPADIFLPTLLCRFGSGIWPGRVTKRIALRRS